MVNPNFPSRDRDDETGHQNGVEIGGQSHSVSMTGTQNAHSPARIIEVEFRNHDKDGDGHIDMGELTNLVKEVMAMKAQKLSPETFHAKCDGIVGSSSVL